MNERWNIYPLRGVGPLRFGMSPDEVAHALGHDREVTDKRVMFDGSTNEYRGLDYPVCSYSEGRLRGIDTDHHVGDVLFEEIDVYKANPRDIISMLKEKNGSAKFGVGILLFDNLSISTNGFFMPKRGFYRAGFDDGQDERTLGVYVEHAFDALMGEFRNVKLPVP